MTREEKIIAILSLNIAANQKLAEYMEAFKNVYPDPKLTKSWFELKPERFYLVESTIHSEEDFTTRVEVRYALRSQEARAYGEGNNAYYKRYLATMAFNLEHVIDPQLYLVAIDNELSKRNTPEDA